MTDPGSRTSLPDAEGVTAGVSASLVDGLLGTAMLPVVLSVIAGSVDVIGLHALGMFTSHITGNVVVLAAHVVSGDRVQVGQLLSVPVFVLVLALTTLLAHRFAAIGLTPLRRLLLLQFLLLAGLLGLCVATDPFADPASASAILAGILGVSAMAVQTVIVLVSLQGQPTGAMTMSVARFTIDVCEVLLGRDAEDVAKARSRAKHSGPVIGGFAIGCGLGAACVAAVGPWSLALPAGLAALAFGMGGTAATVGP